MKPFIVVEPFLKDLPVGWAVHRLRRVAALIEDANSDADAPLLSLTIGGELLPRADDVQPPSAEYLLKYGLVNAGDLVVNPMWLTGGSIGVSAASGAVSPEYRIYRFCRDIHPRFIHHLVRSDPFMHQYRLLVRAETTFDRRVTKEDFRELPLILPPIEVQCAIADYLDTETARINALIAKKQQMLELLRERRQALINAAMSGEADIPTGHGAKWSTVPLKHLARLPITNGVGEAAEFDDPSWPRYIRTTDIAGPRDLRPDTFRSLPPEVAKRAPLRQGDIVMTAAGATIGKSLLYGSTEVACYAGYLVRFRPKPEVDGRFISYWMESGDYWAQIAKGKVVSTIENFSAGKYQNLSCPAPSTEVQNTIADLLDSETSLIDTLLAKQQRTIELLHERRQALITAAVMGELDLPGVAA